MEAIRTIMKPLKAFSATRAGARFFRSTLHHLDTFIYTITGKRLTFTVFGTSNPVIFLKVPGRKSNIMRTTPLNAFPHLTVPGGLYVLATNWGQDHHPAWYLNLMAAGECVVEQNGVETLSAAHELEGEEYELVWPYTEKWMLNYRNYRERVGDARHLPVVALLPKGVNVESLEPPG